MQGFPATTQMFSADQQWEIGGTLYDTPFTPLEGGLASGGVPFDVVEPVDGTQKTWKTFCDAFAALPTNTTVATNFVNSGNTTVQISNGRTDNVIGYWAGGSPGQHGATTPGRVGYHFRCTLRAVAGRTWFSSAATPTWFLALAGNGYMRVDKHVGSTTTTLFAGPVSEKDYLISGYALTAQISDMAAGDYLDIYYLQTGVETWGGFVVKAVAGARGTALQDQAAAQAAHVLGCGLADDGAPPPAQTVMGFKVMEVDYARRRPIQMTLQVPLMNAAVNDGTGWKWMTGSSPDDPGYLEYWHGGVKQATLRRKRLMQLSLGFWNEPYTVFTGFIEDYSQPDGGIVTLTLKSFESRLLDQHDKNYPDPISYMLRGFRQMSSIATTAEPIYPIAAYDNWPVEYVLADLMLRNGIDASRIVKPLAVAKADGSVVPVVIAGDTFLKFRARTLNGKLLRLERPVHYGNGGIGFNEALPADDTYIFQPEITKEIWNRCLEVVERIGYELRFDEYGDAILRPRNNPHWVYDLTENDVV